MGILSDSLHVVAQSLLWPCILGLLLLLIVALMELGGLVFEWWQIRRFKQLHVLDEIIGGKKITFTNLQSLKLPAEITRTLEMCLHIKSQNSAERERLGKQLLEQEELRAIKILEKTDMIAKLGPMLGLMGTLIPLGPGLAALGKGDFVTLAAAVIVAFDTTVAGLAVGGIAYVISKIRRRWYEERLYWLEALLETELVAGGEEFYEVNQKTVSLVGGRS